MVRTYTSSKCFGCRHQAILRTISQQCSSDPAVRQPYRTGEPLRDADHAVSVYLKLTFVFSALLWIPIIWSGHLETGFGLLVPALMWCPGVAALLTCRETKRDLRCLGWRWPRSRFIAVAYVLPIVYFSLAYGAVYVLRLGTWNEEFFSTI